MKIGVIILENFQMTLQMVKDNFMIKMENLFMKVNFFNGKNEEIDCILL